MTVRPGTWAPILKEVKNAARGEVWVVGGFLRDALLNRPTQDLDFAVAEDAKGLAARFAERLGAHAFPLDEERDTHRVALMAAGEKIYVDFSRLQGKTIEQDLARRDFTLNAMAWPLAGKFSRRPSDWIDPFGGAKDAAARRLVLVGSKAIPEDPLRLLRAFRFSAELDFRLTPATLRAVRLHRRKISKSAPERVRDELMKILSTPRGAVAFLAMDRVGLLTILFPEGEPMRRTGHDYYGAGGVLHHSLAAMAAFESLLERLPRYFPRYHRRLADRLRAPVGGYPRSALLKWVELFHDVGKPATAKKEGKDWHFYGHDAVGARLVQDIARRFRFSSGEERSLSRMVGAHMRPGNLGNQPVLTERAIYRFFRDLEDDAVDLLLVALGDHFTYLSERVKNSLKDPVYRAIRTLLDHYYLKRETVHPPKIIDGTLLMKKLKLRPGPVIGRLLDAIREAQATDGVKTVEGALQVARRVLASSEELREPRK